MVPDEYGSTGSSTSPCSDVFSGVQPFSEPETFAIHNFLSNNTGKFDVYLDVKVYNLRVTKCLSFFFLSDAFVRSFNFISIRQL